MDYSSLLTSALFRGLSAAELVSVLKQTPHQLMAYKPGHTVFRQLDKAARIGVILEGQVEAKQFFPTASQDSIAVYKKGDTFGAAAAFSEDGRYPCAFVAKKASTVMMIKPEDFLKMVQSNLHVLENYAKELSSTAVETQQRSELFSYSGIAQKAAFWLLMQYRKTEDVFVELPDSMTNWASLMKVSRTSLHRELRKMEEQGLIKYSSREIEILDVKQLKALLGA